MFVLFADRIENEENWEEIVHEKSTCRISNWIDIFQIGPRPDNKKIYIVFFANKKISTS